MTAPAGDLERRERKRARVALVVAVVGIAVIVGGAFLFVRSHEQGGTELVYEVPPGTGARLAAGDDIEIVPSELHVHPGDRLTIVNRDDRQHELGVLTVRPGETATYAFPNRGVFLGACTVHIAGKLTVYVE